MWDDPSPWDACRNRQQMSRTLVTGLFLERSQTCHPFLCRRWTDWGDAQNMDGSKPTGRTKVEHAMLAFRVREATWVRQSQRAQLLSQFNLCRNRSAGSTDRRRPACCSARACGLHRQLSVAKWKGANPLVQASPQGHGRQVAQHRCTIVDKVQRCRDTLSSGRWLSSPLPGAPLRHSDTVVACDGR